MGLSGIMRTSASGMAAQANRLSTVADNIANSSTTGYKRASTEFSSILLESGSEYLSGSVKTNVRYAIGEQGAFSYTTSSTDLAVNGDGFFIVSNTNGQSFLTRAGSFVKNGDGDLVNAAGYRLMGYSLAGGAPTVVANSFDGLEVVNIGNLALQANPSALGTLFVNLPSNATVVAAADLPSANAATAAYTAKTSLVAYDNLGNEVVLDVYASKTAADTWEIAVFDQAEATGGGFPYTAGPLVTDTLTFDPTTGQLDGVSPTGLSIPIPNGATLALDMSQSSQLAADYMVLEATVNGNAPSAVERVEISDDGIVYAVFENGARVSTYQVPLAAVASPDNLKPLAGNVFAPGIDSGDVQIGFAGSGALGTIVSSALEQSTVDIASELTTMIESQRNYTVNSKVFQTGADLMDVLVNLKR
jgi:flagellar hook protein FlgE